MNELSATKTDRQVLNYFTGGGCFVDLGCGAGHKSVAMVGKYGKVIGMDVDPGKVKAPGMDSTWTFIRADLNEPLALDNAVADGVLANMVIDYILDPAAFVKEIHRILKPGGLIVVTVPNIRYIKNLWRILKRGEGPRTAGETTEGGLLDDGHVHYFTHLDLHRLFRNAGFYRVNTKALIGLDGAGWLRRFLDRHSASKFVREFISGTILLVAYK